MSNESVKKGLENKGSMQREINRISLRFSELRNTECEHDEQQNHTKMLDTLALISFPSLAIILFFMVLLSF